MTQPETHKLTPLPPQKLKTKPIAVRPDMIELEHAQEYIFTGREEKISLSEIFEVLNAPPQIARLVRYLAAFAITRDKRYLRDIVVMITEYLSNDA
jgi:hypothetical protein